MKIPEMLWRVKTIKRTDDGPPGNYGCNSIDCVVVELDDALTEAAKRLSQNETLDVSISKQEITEQYREIYKAEYERREKEKG